MIIMADHGYNGDYTHEDQFMRQAALFMAKGRGENHDTMQVSQAPVSYEDLPQAYERLMDGEQSDAILTGRKEMAGTGAFYIIRLAMSITWLNICRQGMRRICQPWYRQEKFLINKTSK